MDTWKIEFWQQVRGRGSSDNPYAVWESVCLAHRTKTNLPEWAMAELNRIGTEILKLDPVVVDGGKYNNYAEFIADVLRLGGGKKHAATARNNAKINLYALKLADEIDKKKRDILVDDLINNKGLSERQAKRAWKFANQLHDLFALFPSDVSNLSQDDIDKLQKQIESWKNNLPE
jgi:Arc/MetJ-type ribon-helix-helix transcriptional regulator